MLRFTEIEEITKRDLLTISDIQLRNIEIRAFWGGLMHSTMRYEDKIFLIAKIYCIAPDTVKNIVAGSPKVKRG